MVAGKVIASRGPDRGPPAPRLAPEMFVLVLIGVPLVEVFVFIEVGRAIGWPLAVALLLGTSLLGVYLMRVQGRSAIERVSRAVSEHRAPARAALDGALGTAAARLRLTTSQRRSRTMPTSLAAKRPAPNKMAARERRRLATAAIG
jgi:hypothetical protein